MIQKYSKDLDYSYTEGFFPTFEMIKFKRDAFRMVYVSSDAVDSDGYQKLKSIIPADKIVVSDKAFNKIASKENAHVIGVFDKFESVLDAKENHLVMVNPSDMGNLGNAMRSLLAFGYHDLALITPCADKFNPKVVRASMGALFKIRIEEFSSFDEYIAKYPREFYPFVLDTSKPLHEVTFKKPCSLVFGNEATGLPPEIHNHNNVRIEQSDEVDSLNLTTSIAIGLYELKMQN
ncbi:MAG: TrmH family RNA methyltransferase [Bacilli bacterium]|nr:TrmH family RNA methyltransferase [Bacilli bacterium]